MNSISWRGIADEAAKQVQKEGDENEVAFDPKSASTGKMRGNEVRREKERKRSRGGV